MIRSGQRLTSTTLQTSPDGKTFTVQLRSYDKAGNVELSAKRTYHR